jgi:hypothetical protein
MVVEVFAATVGLLQIYKVVDSAADYRPDLSTARFEYVPLDPTCFNYLIDFASIRQTSL